MKCLQDTLAEATNVAEERISNIRTVKSFSREFLEIQRYREKIDSVFMLAKKESLAKGVFYGMVILNPCTNMRWQSRIQYHLHSFFVDRSQRKCYYFNGSVLRQSTCI